MNFFNENYNTFILHAHMHSLLLQNKLSILPHVATKEGVRSVPPLPCQQDFPSVFECSVARQWRTQATDEA